MIDRFDLLELAGRGAMGSVYRARDRQTGQLCAVKKLDVPEASLRFEREAKVLARLRHPHVVRYIDHSETFLAMAWIDGETLGDRLARSPLAEREARTLGARVAGALAFAHEAGVVHRDIKPGNLMLEQGDVRKVQVVDFGIARLAESMATKTGMIMGTPAYMAPEQAAADADVGPAADVFSLGCVLFHAVSGHKPFAAPNIAGVLSKVLLEPAPPLPGPLGPLVARMLEKDPTERPSMDEVARSLEGAIDLHERETLRGEVELRTVAVVLVGAAAGLSDTLSSEQTQHSAALIERFGGRPTPLVAGATLLTFTDPDPARDLADRAARAALAISASIPDAPVGMSVGRAFVNGRSVDGPVIGRAAEALAQAEVGRITVDVETKALIESGFLFDGATLVRVRDPFPRPSELIGRRRDLQVLAGLLKNLEGAEAVLLTGPAGMGKTRLMAELVARADVRVLTGRADPGRPFLLEQIVGPLRAGGDFSGDLMVKAFLDWLEPLLAEPLLIAIDDLQAADEVSLRLLDRALEVFADRPLMVVAAGRDVKDPWPRRGTQILPLGPLSTRAARVLVEQHLSHGDAERILASGAGHPGHLIALARAGGSAASLRQLAEARILRLDAGARTTLERASAFGRRFWASAVGAGAIEALLTADLIVKVSSSLPGEAEYEIVDEDVRVAAYELAHARQPALHLRAGRWLARHGAASSVLAEHFRRAGDDARAGIFFATAAEESLESNDFVAAVAHVEAAVEAGQSSGRLHLVRARASAWLGDVPATLKHAEVATLLSRPGTADWYAAAAEVMSSLGRLGDTEAVVRFVERVLDAPVEDRTARVVCLCRTAEHLLLLGSQAEADRVFERVKHEEAVAPAGAARLVRARARFRLHEGEMVEAAEGLAEAIALFESMGDLRNATNERMNLGFVYGEIGDFGSAVTVLRKAEADAKRMGLHQVIAWIDNNLANALRGAGQIKASIDAADRAIAAAEAQQDVRLEGATRAYLARSLLALGDLAAAEEEATRATVRLAKLPGVRAMAEAVLAEILLRRRETDRARKYARAAMNTLRQLGRLEEGEALIRDVHRRAMARRGSTARLSPRRELVR